MKHYTHILLATDFKPECGTVAEQALDLAARYGAKISLVHVLETTPMVYGAGEFALPFENTVAMELLKEAEQKIKQTAVQFKVDPACAYIVSGSTAAEIAQLAIDKQIDLIAVGGHHATGLRLLFGSTANAVLHAMPCDILAVRLPS